MDMSIETGQHVCPWWVGYLLASPLRRVAERPEAVLSAWVRPGSTVLDYGSAMGFFSIPAARLTGSEGRVVAVDVQERMLRSLQRRLRRKGLEQVVETRLCTQGDSGLADLEGQVDVAVAFHVIHETSQPRAVVSGIASSLRPGGVLILAEPRGHTSQATRAFIFGLPLDAGLVREREIALRKSDAAVFRSPWPAES
jgi:2-polyprenyl-3-methyl-5-hydroxy-6-metoxy-1,4-benzoquinol methylase